MYTTLTFNDFTFHVGPNSSTGMVSISANKWPENPIGQEQAGDAHLFSREIGASEARALASVLLSAATELKK